MALRYRSQLAAALLASIVPGAAAAGQLSAQSVQPNIIFVLVDDLGYGDLGVFHQNARSRVAERNKPWHRTPNLDKFAENGIQLRSHYASAPVCAPSRASLLTGVHQGHAHVRDNQFDKALDDNHTLATVLKEGGYVTAVIGKWGLQGDSKWDGPGQYNSPETWPAYPTKRGFDYFFGYVGHREGHVHYPKEGALRRSSKPLWDQNEEISESLDKAYSTDLFTARAKKWITDQVRGNPDQPFFLYLAYTAPHATIEVPTQAYPKGGGLEGGVQWMGQKGHMINTASGTINSYCHPDYVAQTWDDDNDPKTPEVPWPDVYKRYATMVRRIDDAIGDIVQTLKDLQVDENTLIVFTSDNGISNESYLSERFSPEFFGSFGPFDGLKRELWEGGVRVGALVRWPARIAAGSVSDAPSQFHDWLPTLANVAGLPAPARADGVSLLPTLTAEGDQEPGVVYAEYYHPGKTPEYSQFSPEKRGKVRGQMQMLRVGDFVGVRYDIQNAQDDFKIYNVNTDPQQLNDLAGQRDDLQRIFKERVLTVRLPEDSVPRPYDTEPVAAVDVPHTVVSGVNWEYWRGDFPWLPKLEKLGRIADAVGNSLSIAPTELPQEQEGAVLYSGYIDVAEDGVYIFYLRSHGKALLRLHDVTVIDADYVDASVHERSGAIALRAGKHPFRLYYMRDVGGEAPLLQLDWQRENAVSFERNLIPVAGFYRDAEKDSSRGM